MKLKIFNGNLIILWLSIVRPIVHSYVVCFYFYYAERHTEENSTDGPLVSFYFVFKICCFFLFFFFYEPLIYDAKIWSAFANGIPNGGAAAATAAAAHSVLVNVSGFYDCAIMVVMVLLRLYLITLGLTSHLNT